MCEMKEPVIRFKGYTDEWEQRKLGELVNIGDIDHRMPKTVECGIPYLMTGDFCGINELNFDGVKHISEEDYEQLSRKIKPEKNDILFARYASVGAVRYVDFTDKFLISYSCAIIKHGDKIDSKYLYHYLTSDIAQRQIALEINTGSQANIGIDSMKNNILVQMPCVDEQRTVASYLDSLDNLITLHQRKCDDLQEVKKYMLQKLFPQNGAKIPEIRFAGFIGEWEQRKLREFASKVTTKNAGMQYTETLTNSAEQGIISQRDYFDHDVSNMDNIDGYYIVENNDFVYNPRISTSAPVGPVNRNKLGRTGVMSPLYTVFKTHDVDESYLEWFFKSSHWHQFMYFNGDTGARSDRFAIKDAVFFDMPIPTPDIEEQRKVGSFLTEMDNLIAHEQSRCDDLKEVKKFMLQNMFPRREASPMGEG